MKTPNRKTRTKKQARKVDSAELLFKLNRLVKPYQVEIPKKKHKPRKMMGGPQEAALWMARVVKQGLKDSKIRNVFAKMAVEREDGDFDPKQIRARLDQVLGRDSKRLDALGSPDGFPCLAYWVYLMLKNLTYGWTPVRPVSGVVGRLSSVDGFNPGDGDFSFDLDTVTPPIVFNGTTFGTLHCEITVCDQGYNTGFIEEVVRRKDESNVIVSVDGLLAFDPSHTILGPPSIPPPPGAPPLGVFPATLEIHPVTSATITGDTLVIVGDVLGAAAGAGDPTGAAPVAVVAAVVGAILDVLGL